jgi:hypothetical protein
MIGGIHNSGATLAMGRRPLATRLFHFTKAGQQGAKLEPMIQFYVSTKDEARRCRASFDQQAPITILGTTDGDNVQSFTGVVRSIDEDKTSPSMRWRVTMVSERE